MFKLIIGLGNPGKEYVNSRHNVGYRLVESLSKSGWKDFQKLGLIVNKDSLMLAKPTTYMNTSGKFVLALSQFYKIPPSEILICFDDVALPLGKIRLRTKGQSGGQKGMQSIIEHLGTTSIPRLRIGTGPKSEGVTLTNYVLGSFSNEEEKILSNTLKSSSLAIQTIIDQGLAKAMNQFNK